MRTIGTLESDEIATRFSDYLYVKGIENQTEREDDGTFSVWVLDDDQLNEAAAHLRHFRTNPSAPEFDGVSATARRVRTRVMREENSRRSTFADTARVGYERHFRGAAPVTLALIVISALVALWSHLGENTTPVRPLFISDYLYDFSSGTSIHLPTLLAHNGELTPALEARATRHGFLPEVRSGQVWRLITPIFLHFGILHLVFDMMMLYQLGTFTENRLGGRHLLALVLVIAALSNTGEALWGSPNFGGMSGVDYGLFGFLWIRGKCDPAAGWQINKNVVTQLLVWFVLCLVHIIPHVANTVHAIGLGIGMAWGYISAKR